jgi:ADP-heptose:LPS heptosyltransferase
LKKILIVKPSSLGDVVHGVRVVRQIKIAFPESKIHWVIKRGLEGILDAVGWVDKYFIFERGRGLFTYLKLISEIRKFEYDYCLDLQGLMRSALITKFSNSKVKLGRSDGREFSTFFYNTVGLSHKNLQIHAIDRLTAFLPELGITKFDESLPLDLNSNSKLKNTIPARSIILFPESRRSEKVWPYFKELAIELNKFSQWKVIIAGNHKDNRFHNCVDMRDSITLSDLPSIINKASLVICNDSAPLHIASALRKKLVALFGPTEAVRYGPYPTNHQNNIIIRSSTGRMEDIKLTSVLNGIECLLE